MRLLKPLLANPILRSMTGVGAAVSLSYLLGLAATPALSRLYNAEQFGLFALFLGLANVFSPIVMLGMSDAILAPHEEADARSLFGFAARAVLAALPLIALATFVLIRFDLMSYGILPLWSVLLMPFAVAGINALVLLQMWAIRRRTFRGLAASHLTLGISRCGAQILGGLAGLGLLGLAGGDLLSRILAAGTLARRFRTDVQLLVGARMRDVFRVAWAYRRFALFRTPSALANSVTFALPAALIATAFGVAPAGQYSMMFTIVIAPIALAQRAVGDVFVGHFAALSRESTQAGRRLTLTTGGGLLLVSLPLALLLALAGEPLLTAILGEQWRQAGNMAALFAPLLIADMTTGPLGGLLNAANRPGSKLFFDVARIAGLLAAYALAKGQSAEAMVGLFVWFSVASDLLYAALIWHAASRPRRS